MSAEAKHRSRLSAPTLAVAYSSFTRLFTDIRFTKLPEDSSGMCLKDLREGEEKEIFWYAQVILIIWRESKGVILSAGVSR